MIKQCTYCNSTFDLSDHDNYTKLVLQVNGIVCSSCEETKVRYECSMCSKTLTQKVAVSKMFGFSIKNYKVCFDCNSNKMSETVIK
jgi:hypothetical protein